jgi:site-specific DNA-cytosine methylase
MATRHPPQALARCPSPCRCSTRRPWLRARRPHRRRVPLQGSLNGREAQRVRSCRDRSVARDATRHLLVENVAHILALHDGAVWGEVLGDLAALGYDVVWDCVPAGAVGAPHRRDRVFAVASYADGGGSQAGAQQDQRTPGGLRAPLRHDADRRGVRVEWGDYEPAIRRWEAIHGPAPAPLVQRIRGMDDRSAARVERSRLSALGDGVQCQVGRIAGEYIVSLERARLAGAAPSMIPGAARTG